MAAKLEILKVISGGQTGADQAGLIAAKLCGLNTGGTMPAGFRTLDGPNPEFAAEYGLRENLDSSYRTRTIQNVADSDGTIRFAKNFSSPGERLTLKAIRQHNKPYIDVNIDNPVLVSKVQEWLIQHKVKVLNIAGNSEQTAPGIAAWVGAYLIDLFGG